MIKAGAVLSYPRPLGLKCFPVDGDYEIVVDVDSQNKTITVIVVDVDSQNKTITVIRLQEPQEGQSEISPLSKNNKIVKIEKRFNETKINTKIDCLDNEKVVDRAKKALETQTINGKEIENLVNLNSKHFADYCKTGQLDI